MPDAPGKVLNLYGRHQFRHLRKLVIRQFCLQCESFITQFLYAPFDKVDVFCYENAVLGQERRYGNGLLSCNLGDNAGLFDTLPRQLAFNFECPYAVDLISEEVDTVRKFR